MPYTFHDNLKAQSQTQSTLNIQDIPHASHFGIPTTVNPMKFHIYRAKLSANPTQYKPIRSESTSYQASQIQQLAHK